MSEPSSLSNRRDLLAASAAAGALNVFPVGAAKAAGGDAIRPFTVHVPQAELDELRPLHALRLICDGLLFGPARGSNAANDFRLGTEVGVQVATPSERTRNGFPSPRPCRPCPHRSKFTGVSAAFPSPLHRLGE
jgi:hypothetical protein